MPSNRYFAIVSLGLIVAVAGRAAAQEIPREPLRTRVMLGPQLVPSYPGSDSVSLRPFVDVSRARGAETFEFEAPDESFGFSLIDTGGLEIGPALGIEGKRDSADVGAPIHRVGFSFEAGAFVQAQLTDALRLRVEARKGLIGHRGLIGVVSADYVARDGDTWLFSIGPRVTFADDRYQRAYFGVTTADAAAANLPAFDAKGGVQSLGLAAGALRQLSARWGIAAYGRYDRLVGDAADSPVTRQFGSPNQFSAGIGLSYTFGRLP